MDRRETMREVTVVVGVGRRRGRRRVRASIVDEEGRIGVGRGKEKGEGGAACEGTGILLFFENEWADIGLLTLLFHGLEGHDVFEQDEDEGGNEKSSAEHLFSWQSFQQEMPSSSKLVIHIVTDYVARQRLSKGD
jgi:hypothetical protein